MRKLILILFFFFLSIANLYSQSWVLQNSGTSEQVHDIFFINNNTGYASCSGGMLLKTANSGINWIYLPGPYSNSLINVVFFNINTGIVFGNPIYKTTNAGLNWFQVANLFGTLNHSMIADSVTAYGCQPFQLSKTTDRGSNWSVTSSTPPWITTSAFFYNSLTGWVTTIEPIGMPTPYLYRATVAKTINGGTNWLTLYTETGPLESNIMYDTYFTSLDTGYIIGKSGTAIYRSFNGGINWQETSIVNDSLNDLYFLNSRTGWAVSEKGFVYKTINSGSIWTNTSTPTSGNLVAIRFINSETGWAVGANGTIIKTTNGGVSAVNILSNETPKEYSLSQNYPNPFNPQTKIKFDIPANVKGQTSIVKLIIYDLLGREVATLVNEELRPGTYEADWDGSNYSSGVYFYKIISSDFVETKKMVLMK